MLYLVGFGLSSTQDLTLKALSILKKCDTVFVDAYTSCTVEVGALDDLRDMIGKPCIEADRKMVEQGTEILKAAKLGNAAFLVIGDPLSATTHIDLVQRAIVEDIPFETVNNTSIVTAVGLSGLCLYEFGRTVSIPLWDEFGETTSFYDKIEMNLRIGTHTLCLLDIKVKEQSLNNLLKGNDIYEPARFMTCEMAAKQIVLTIERLQAKSEAPLIAGSHLLLGLARMGSSEQRMVVATLDTFSNNMKEGRTELTRFLGRPLHSLVVLGPLQAMEMEHILFSITKLKSEVNQPVFFMGPNTRSTPSDEKAVKRLLHDHHLRCQRIATFGSQELVQLKMKLKALELSDEKQVLTESKKCHHLL